MANKPNPMTAYFFGSECSVNPGHGSMRYSSSGHCVQCKRSGDTRRYRDGQRKSPVGKELKRAPGNFHHRVFVLGDITSASLWLNRPVWRRALC